MDLATFKKLPKKDLESFKKVSKYDRERAFPYLDNKSLEAFKLIESKYDRSDLFEYLDYKDIEAFKLLDDYGKEKCYYLLDYKNFETFKLLPLNGYLKKELFNSLYNNIDYFRQLSNKEKGYLFKYLKNKSFEIYKNDLDSSSRGEAFPY